MSSQTPSAARVVKTTAFSLAEWASIEALMKKLGVREFTVLSRMGLADLADKHDIPWPGEARKAS